MDGDGGTAADGGGTARSVSLLSVDTDIPCAPAGSRPCAARGDDPSDPGGSGNSMVCGRDDASTSPEVEADGQAASVEPSPDSSLNRRPPAPAARGSGVARLERSLVPGPGRERVQALPIELLVEAR
mmetsp:Transcript_11830/g.30867  ORF Transcript_11830/g.30867 Transcript_11830/m.30867 type:complete len:127 (+) Transcript_11830:562-942(+)